MKDYNTIRGRYATEVSGTAEGRSIKSTLCPVVKAEDRKVSQSKRSIRTEEGGLFHSLNAYRSYSEGLMKQGAS